MFRVKGNQPPLGVIFRGKGKRISEDEKKAWHPSTHVFFQPNAWMDINVANEWMEKTLEKFVKDEGMERFVLLLDNLSTHTEENFKKSVCDLGGLVWFGLPDATDLWQPVDAGYAQVLKSLISKEQQLWLDEEENADRWFGNDKPFSAKERRILISHWAGEAWDKLSSEKYDSFREGIWQTTGCMMTVDGTNDEKIKPEGLAQYTVPPPSVVEPTPQTPVVNTPDTVVNINEDDYEEEVNELENEENDFEVSNEGQDDGERDGIFDIFHLLV